MKKIRVLQVNKLYYPVTGGIEKVVQDLSEGFAKDDEIDNRVLVCQKKGKGISEIQNGVRVRRSGSFGMFSSMPLSFSFLSEFRIMAKKRDIVHIHTPFPLGDLACLLSGYKGKVVVWWHSDIVRQKKLLWFYRPLMEWLLRRSDAIIVATEGHIKGSKYLPRFKEKCHVIPFGVDRELMEDADRYLKQNNNMVNQNEGLVHFLFAGRLVYYKGCDVLLKAFAAMQCADADLTLVGDGQLKEELKQLSRELGIMERVHFLGEVDREELYRQFAACDVFVLPSVAPSEAFGIVQIEAMAYGKPVINTNLKSGVPYVSIDGKTGFTVEPGDVNALAETMVRCVKEVELRQKLGVNAAKRVRNQYSMDMMLDQTKELYEKLLGL